ncbi:hypothetical protein BURPS406E_C1645 [Burkholderia pseudomallei 406e]|nr:hypothetical protein BURPS406E_C1645 [Burkholderia pseudomallei 406e]EDO94434.1 hypothetical protein BURPSPAST_V0076 [Burkholderia pseudomallei Pasteur 52237]EEC37802.1 conserved hypothetical protein [Burkholderia pseudomallei 576]KGS80138.1 ribonuclease E domain protein [Burkholderia pseudomallei MSHR7500]KOT09284.1 ribonuclease E domain protein [Burkholderia mallei]
MPTNAAPAARRGWRAGGLGGMPRVNAFLLTRMSAPAESSGFGKWAFYRAPGLIGQILSYYLKNKFH